MTMGVVPPGQPSLESIIDGEPTAPVKTKIVCTLGPKVRETRRRLQVAGRRLHFCDPALCCLPRTVPDGARARGAAASG